MISKQSSKFILFGRTTYIANHRIAFLLEKRIKNETKKWSFKGEGGGTIFSPKILCHFSPIGKGELYSDF